jgi:hypothetical protein
MVLHPFITKSSIDGIIDHIFFILCDTGINCKKKNAMGIRAFLLQFTCAERIMAENECGKDVFYDPLQPNGPIPAAAGAG